MNLLKKKIVIWKFPGAVITKIFQTAKVINEKVYKFEELYIQIQKIQK